MCRYQLQYLGAYKVFLEFLPHFLLWRNKRNRVCCPVLGANLGAHCLDLGEYLLRHYYHWCLKSRNMQKYHDGMPAQQSGSQWLCAECKCSLEPCPGSAGEHHLLGSCCRAVIALFCLWVICWFQVRPCSSPRFPNQDSAKVNSSLVNLWLLCT